MTGKPGERYVTQPFARALVAQAAEDPRLVCVTNDLTASCEADGFRAAYPERYLSLGMAEQNIAGVLSGLAREGMIPVYPTFAVFATRRPYEQIALNIAYPALPVRIFGFLPGLSTPGGATHQSIDDVALMRQLPNMTVLEVGDATEVETVWQAIADIPGPVYCRMLRGEVRRQFTTPMVLGGVRTLARGTDAVLVTSGLMTELGTAVVDHARGQGIQISHLHVATLKPFPADLLSAAISAGRSGVVTAENHLRGGALGTAVAELIAEGGLGKRLVRVGIDDTFAVGGGREYLFRRFGISGQSIAEALDAIIPGADLGRTFAADDGAGNQATGASAIEAL
ncbi:MAG TPA: transketolase C-terminal domain-containing protein [Streptosporangiaceae bacterium]